ncbi:DUF5937 family protein [Levilactobacillus brevis]|uniref:DUF5937 family protein n=1 Tax=Levilactobacillus brevis TaxID=1580 RepID=UPI000B35A878|nr:DUF5937 family protein [Levilactobacillus brevis]
MAIELKFEKKDLRNSGLLKTHARFVFSPLNELFCSLHVLKNSDHRGMLISWKLEAISQLDTLLINDMNYFSPLYEFGVPNFLIPGLNQNVTTLSEEIDCLKQRFTDRSTESFVRAFVVNRNSKQQAFLPSNQRKWEWDQFDQSHDNLLNDLLNDPKEVIERFFHFIERYNDLIFNAIWEKAHIADILKHEVDRQSKILKTLGFSEVIHELDNDKIFWNGKKVMIYQPFAKEHYISSQDVIHFVPSYFIWPHLSIQNIHNGIVITYDLSKRTIQQTNNIEMEKILKAVGDGTRIQILNFLKQMENTTQGMAQLLSLSESTVSRDLNILKSAGLVSSRRVNKVASRILCK